MKRKFLFIAVVLSLSINSCKAKEKNVNLHGYLLVLDPVTMVPARDDSIFLVPLLETNGPLIIPEFEKGDVPQAEVNEVTGEFTFYNVAIGQYAIVVITMAGAQVPVRNYTDGSYGIVTVEESNLNKTIELGYLTLP